MAYNTKEILKDKDLNPISQYYNPTADKYEAVEGANGGNKVVVENNDLSLLPILDKLSQLTGTVIDEETRKSNEIDRKSKEVTRESNESTRKSNETARVSQENTRKSNETTRGTAEGTRVTQENTRKNNELARIALHDLLNSKLNNGEFNGKDLEYNWNGTQLGVRLKGESTYSYVDLKGDTGSISGLNSTHIQTALGFLPKDYVAGTNVTITGNSINAKDTVYTHPTGTNPHGTTKSDVGLGNLTNDKQMPINGGTFTGQAKFANDTSYGVFKGRNIASGTANPSGGSNGDIYFKRKS